MRFEDFTFGLLLTPKMGEKRKVGYVNREEFVDRLRKQFSPEYAEFMLIQMGHSPKVCPKCGNGSFTTLWLAKPNDAINGMMWAKWYFWCDRCLSGIRCPLASGATQDLRRLAPAPPSTGLGGLFKTSLRWPRIRHALSRPLHASRGHLQPPPGLFRRWPSHLSLA